IAAKADVHARMEFGAALTDEDLAAADALAAKALHAEPLTRRIAPVARRAACFFMRHSRLLLAGADSGDLHRALGLAMAALAAIGRAAGLLKDLHLLALGCFNELARHGDAREVLAELQRAAVARHQHVLERDGGAGFAVELLHDDLVVLGHPILLAAGLNH